VRQKQFRFLQSFAEAKFSALPCSAESSVALIILMGFYFGKFDGRLGGI